MGWSKAMFQILLLLLLLLLPLLRLRLLCCSSLSSWVVQHTISATCRVDNQAASEPSDHSIQRGLVLTQFSLLKCCSPPLVPPFGGLSNPPSVCSWKVAIGTDGSSCLKKASIAGVRYAACCFFIVFYSGSMSPSSLCRQSWRFC